MYIDPSNQSLHRSDSETLPGYMSIALRSLTLDLPRFSLEQVEQIERILGVKCSGSLLYSLAFSQSGLNKRLGHAHFRLESLGDGVLELALRELMLERGGSVTDKKNTDLARARSNHRLAAVAERSGLLSFIRSSGRKKSADAVEAVLGAIYLENGMSSVIQAVANLYELKAPHSRLQRLHSENWQELTLAEHGVLLEAQSILGHRFRNISTVERLVSKRSLSGEGSADARFFNSCQKCGEGVALAATRSFIFHSVDSEVDPVDLSRYFQIIQKNAFPYSSENVERLALRVSEVDPALAHVRGGRRLGMGLLALLYQDIGFDGVQTALAPHFNQVLKESETHPTQWNCSRASAPQAAELGTELLPRLSSSEAELMLELVHYQHNSSRYEIEPVNSDLDEGPFRCKFFVDNRVAGSGVGWEEAEARERCSESALARIRDGEFKLPLKRTKRH